MQNKFLRALLLIVFLLAAVILGEFLGRVVDSVTFLAWLGKEVQFGFSPFTLDLAVVNMTLGFQFAVNIAQMILLVAVIIIYVCCIARD